MAPKHAPTCFLLKFDHSTVLLPVTSSTTLNLLRTTLLEALTLSRPEEGGELDPEPVTLPKAASEIALWKKDEEDEEEEDKWVLLTDEKSGADKWGLREGAHIGVSFRKPNGSFPPPSIVEPPVDDE